MENGIVIDGIFFNGSFSKGIVYSLKDDYYYFGQIINNKFAKFKEGEGYPSELVV
jgi:hypothetical protein